MRFRRREVPVGEVRNHPAAGLWAYQWSEFAAARAEVQIAVGEALLSIWPALGKELMRRATARLIYQVGHQELLRQQWDEWQQAVDKEGPDA